MWLDVHMKLGLRNELASIADPYAQKARYDGLLATAYLPGKALRAGVSFAFDDVIDPAYTRRTVGRTVESVPKRTPRTGKKRPVVDP